MLIFRSIITEQKKLEKLRLRWDRVRVLGLERYEKRPMLSATIYADTTKTFVFMSIITGMTIIHVADEVFYMSTLEIEELDAPG